MYYYFYSQEQRDWSLDTLKTVYVKDQPVAYTEMNTIGEPTWPDAVEVAISKKELGVSHFTAETPVPKMKEVYV